MVTGSLEDLLSSNNSYVTPLLWKLLAALIKALWALFSQVF